MMLVAVLLGTTAMVNAQVTPVKTAPAKEVKAAKHVNKTKVAKKVEPAKAETAKAKK